MEDNEDKPVLVSCKPLKPEFGHLQKIAITSDEFTIGRGVQNSVVIPFLSISRQHCMLKKQNDEEWLIEDLSSFGIKINNEKLGKGSSRILSDDDVLSLDPADEFVYKVNIPNDFEIPKKRMRMDSNCDSNIINSMKIKFEASQCDEIKHIEEKILNAKLMQTTSMKLKEQIQLDMDRKMQQLQSDFALQIESLKGEKNEVEKQKALLIEERDALLKSVQAEMEGKISDLMEQIQKHNETESELLKENNLLKEKLQIEREEFLLELSRESSSKHEMLENLEAKVKEQEEIRLKEKEQMLRENEQLRLTKEKELKELEELKRQREIELEEELSKIKKNLEDQIEQSEHQKQIAEQKLNEQVQEMKKLSDEEKHKMEQLVKERAEIQKQLSEAQMNAEKSLEELRKRVSERETELAALAAERIQKQAEQSGVVISTLQEQLEKAKSQLQSVETEKNTLLESICFDAGDVGTSTKQSTLTEVGELMESELQCSICAELFVEATTLNCSHTFCKYCISMWKKKKNDCPICRSPIKTECKSLVLDTFIEKMVQNLTEDMKKKRQSILEYRAELVAEQERNTAAGSRRRSDSYDDSEESYDDEYNEGEEEDYGIGEDFYEDSDEFLWSEYGRRRYHGFDDDEDDDDIEGPSQSDTDSGSDDDANTGHGTGAPAGTASTSNAAGQSTGGNDPNTRRRRGGDDTNNRRRRRGNVPGIPGSFYGGYGRCYSCGARGHWAPGCPFR